MLGSLKLLATALRVVLLSGYEPSVTFQRRVVVGERACHVGVSFDNAGSWFVFAFETSAKASLTEALDSHAHEFLGTFEHPKEAIRCANAFLRTWKRSAPRTKCECGPIQAS